MWWKHSQTKASSFFPEKSLGSSHAALSGKFRYAWIADAMPQQQESDVSSAARAHFIGRVLSSKKTLVIGCIVWLVVVGLFVRTGMLQTAYGRLYLHAADENRYRYYPEPAPRGIIFDKNGVPLVENVPSFTITVSPRDILPFRDRRERIRSALDMTNEEMDLLLSAPDIAQQEYVVVKENLTYEKVIRVIASASDVPGLFVQTTAYRNYRATPKSLSHLLGYVGKMSPEEWNAIQQKTPGTVDPSYASTDIIGKNGVEKQYEHLLRGRYGVARVEVDALGRHSSEAQSIRSISGDSVTLTIDVQAQQKLEEIMQAWMQRANKRRAAAVAIDPRDGAVLALISLPAYDNNAFVRSLTPQAYETIRSDPDHPLFHRAISGQYPSGSTIKPFIAAAALQEGIITDHTTFLSTGGLAVGKWFFQDWRAGGHGITDVRKAIAWSVNTFFYIIGGGWREREGLGPERMRAYLQQFGFAAKTGIDAPGEAEGFLPSREWKMKTKNEQWYIGDTYNFSIGQGDVLVTPLQLAAAVASIANNGTLYRPHLVYSVQSSTGDTTIIEPSVTNAKSIDSEHLAVVRSGMRQTVVSGSAGRLAGLPVAVAGKTGTAQWSSDKEPHAWFASFAPYQEPRVALVVLVEEGEEGATIAAGIAREFYAWWARY